jgi:hypothetical protein
VHSPHVKEQGQMVPFAGRLGFTDFAEPFDDKPGVAKSVGIGLQGPVLVG